VGLLPLQAEASALPFPPRAFDGILVPDALHHFLEPHRVARETLRALKPGGRLLVEDQDITRHIIKIVRTAEKQPGFTAAF